MFQSFPDLQNSAVKAATGRATHQMMAGDCLKQAQQAVAMH